MDISDIISSLSDEDMENLKNVAASLFSSTEQPAQADKNTPDISKIITGLSSFKTNSPDDERIALIKALRPMLCEENKRKADEIIKLLHLIKLIPVIKSSGILNGLLGEG